MKITSKRQINEEMSINFEVQEIAKRLVRQVGAKINSNQIPFCTRTVLGYPNQQYAVYPVMINLFNGAVQKVIFRIHLFTFKDGMDFVHSDKYEAGGEYSPGMKLVHLNIYGIQREDGKGNIFDLRSAEDSLTHELLHAFQHSRGNVNLGKYYRHDIANDLTQPPYVRELSFGSYILCSGEIDANANQLYQELNRYQPKTAEEAYKMPTYMEFANLRNNLNKAFNIIESDEGKVSLIESLFNSKYESIKRFLLNGLKRCANKYSKVIAYHLQNLAK